jgi:folate-binding protein YgfZ
MTATAQSETSVLQTGKAALELSALLGGVGVARLRDTGWIRVSGEDRVRWLNGMVTNSVQELKPGEGAYNFLLNVQGRIQGDGVIFAEADALRIETAKPQVAGMMKMLDHFIIMDDVELADVSSEWSGLQVVGALAASALEKIGIATAELKPLEIRTMSWNGAGVSVVRGYSPLVPLFEVWAGAGETAAKIFDALRSAGAVVCDAESLEWLRILEGTPLYGTDIRDRELPQETGQTRALHFAKGCYLGQEIVERIRSRGNVHRMFSGFRLEGELPAAGAVLEAEGKAVGELTSVAAVPVPASAGDGSVVEQLALGYVRREAVERGVPLVYAGGVAVPVSLPFLSAAASGLRAASEPSERV